MNKLVLLALGLATSGCSTAIAVYDKVDNSNTDSSINGDRTFKFPDTMVMFNYQTKSGTPDPETLVITSVPVDGDGDMFTLHGANWYNFGYGTWGTTTNITSTMDTANGSGYRLTKLSTGTSNDLVTFVNAAGSAATAAAGLAVLAMNLNQTPPATPSAATPVCDGSEKYKLPTGIKISQLLKYFQSLSGCTSTEADKDIVCKGLVLEGGLIGGKPYTADIKIGPIPKNAKSLPAIQGSSQNADNTRTLNFPYHGSVALYSACRDMTITVTIPEHNSKSGACTSHPESSVTQSFTVNDERWVQATTLPPQGTVTYNICGADTTLDPNYKPSSPILDLITAIGNQAKTASSALTSTSSSGVKSK